MSPGRFVSPLALTWTLVVSAQPAMAQAGTQSALTQLGLTETAARGHILRVVKLSGEFGYEDPMVTTGRAAFRKVPPSARAQVATGLFAWAKAYVHSPDFLAAYKAMRAEATPAARQYASTIDEEVRKQLDDQLAGFANIQAAIAAAPPEERAKARASLEESERKVRSPDMEKLIRQGIEADRAEERARHETAMKQLEERYPSNPEVLFARCLREFLATTSDVDYSATITNIALTGPEALDFDNPAYRSKPWQWMEAVIVGREAATAARSAAVAWLKEIDQK